MKFNEKLTTLRKSHGYTQEQLAEQLGVSRQAVSRWELGDTTPEMNILIQLCKIFDVSADYLINEEYSSENDIPVVKKKEHEMKEENKKYHYFHLVSAFAFGIAWCWSVIGVFEVSNYSQKILAGIMCGLMAFNCIIQIGLFIRKNK